MRRPLTILLAATILASCGAAATTAPAGTTDTVPGVGSLPETLRLDPVDAVPAGTIVPRVTVVDVDENVPVADRITGDRLLVIGDSIFASMSRRYGGELCDTLVPVGWEVEVNAEVGRFVEFAGVVLDRRLRPEAGVDWDAAVITLGSNFGGDLDAYRARLLRALDRLEPRPVVLVTVSEFRPDRAQVNEVIREVARFYSEVRVLEWGATTAAEPALLSADRLHPSDAGRARLASDLAVVLGSPSPDGGAGSCLASSFVDDSAIDGVDSIGAVTTTPRTTTAAGATRSTTTAPVARPTTTTGSSGGSSGSGGGSGTNTTTTTTTTTVAATATTTEAPTSSVAVTTLPTETSTAPTAPATSTLPDG